MAIVNHSKSGEYDPHHDPDPTIRESTKVFDDRGWNETHLLGLESELPPGERAFRGAVGSAHAALHTANIRRDAAELALKDAKRMADRRREELAALLDNLPPQSPKS